MLREQLANAVEERIAHRLGDELERQWVAAVEARQRTHLACRPGDVLRRQEALTGRVVEATQLERAHGCGVAFEWPQLGGLFPAGQHNAAVVLALAQGVQQRTVLGVASSIGAGERARLQNCFEIVKNEEATPLAKQLSEQRDLAGYLVRRCRMLVGDRTD